MFSIPHAQAFNHLSSNASRIIAALRRPNLPRWASRSLLECSLLWQKVGVGLGRMLPPYHEA